jgi:hypothetical protein
VAAVCDKQWHGAVFDGVSTVADAAVGNGLRWGIKTVGKNRPFLMVDKLVSVFIE